MQFVAICGREQELTGGNVGHIDEGLALDVSRHPLLCRKLWCIEPGIAQTLQRRRIGPAIGCVSTIAAQKNACTAGSSISTPELAVIRQLQPPFSTGPRFDRRCSMVP